MKIAIFHNFLDNIGGAEYVVLTLARELGADVYTTNRDAEKQAAMGFADVPVYSIGTVPLNAPLRQQCALQRFRSLRLGRRYDLYIIAGDWAVSAAPRHRPNIWYVHSPIREIWDLYHYTRANIVPWYLRPAFDAWAWYNRRLNKRFIRHVDRIACNSQNTQKRVARYLQREACVLHPPVETKDFYHRDHEGYWLSVNRLITHKRVDVQLEAFRSLPDERLIIVGSYEQSRHFVRYAEYIKQHMPPNVEIRHWVSRAELLELYARCKGFITTAKDEDFGLTVVEAMAAGKPVIAPNEGGYRESVIHGETGILLDDVTPRALRHAIESVTTSNSQYKAACPARAAQFDTGVFIERFRNMLQ